MEGLKKVISTKMNCPRCGAEMNVHAEKIVYSVITDAGQSEADWLNTSLQEFHACPRCGAVASQNIGA